MSDDKNESGHWKYKEKTWAKIKDLTYYLGEDWIDIGSMGNDAVIAKFKAEATSNYQPHKCPACNRYWHYALNRSEKKETEYLRDTIFGGVPAIKKKCCNC
tara:strand:+ start:1198 stop:1500 length:303 start_codon:yes stop_codon:yes gene_type:complete